MVQKKFMDIENLREGGDNLAKPNNGAFEVGDIISITEKVDGSNFCIAYDSETDSLAAFSRKQELSYSNTLEGAWNFAQSLDPAPFKAHPSYRVFGEWLRRNRIVYKSEMMKKWYVYDIYDMDSESYLPQQAVKEFCKEAGLEYIHVLYEGPFVSWEHARSFLHSPAYGDRQEGCFSSRVKVLMSDGTSKLIKDIEVGDVVKSYNPETKEIENKRVLSVFFNGHKPIDEWECFCVFPRGKSAQKLISGKTVVTKQHQFFDGSGYSAIEDLDYVYHYEMLFDHYREQAFLGLISSDGNISKYSFKISQKEERMNDIEELFEPFLNKQRPVNISGKGSKIKTIAFAKQLTQTFCDRYAIDHNVLDYVKIFEDLDDIGWAYFYVGDGCAHKKTKEVILDLSSFDDDEVENIGSCFYRNFGLEYSIYKDKRVSNGSGKSLRLTSSNGRAFLKRISKYILPSHRYKLVDIADAEAFENPPQFYYSIAKRKIFKKVPYSDTKYSDGHKTVGAWDLEVKDNHNYFANGCLVHNCVIKNQSKLGDKSIRLPIYLKIVNDEFKETSHVRMVDPEKEAARENAFALAESIVTKNRVEKELYKMRDEQILPGKLEPKDMGLVAKTLPKRIFDDCVKEEKETVVACGEYFGKACSSLCMKYAKELIL